MDLIWSILLMLRPWMGYDYTVIQVDINPRGKTLLSPQFELVFKTQERKNQVIDKYLDPMINKEQRTKGLKESKTVENLSKGTVEILLQEPNENSFQELRFDG